MTDKSKESQILTSNLNICYVNVTRLPLPHRSIYYVIPSSYVLKERPPSVRLEMRVQSTKYVAEFCLNLRSLNCVWILRSGR
jgi:hypothetical protein